ncbi:MAG: polysaccharide deacetylase family protein [Candidatus Vogelbacteria bacterium]|nr:polysaccharide deacetylase family protein [Candidatus Vogelbacteria bacterium]
MKKYLITTGFSFAILILILICGQISFPKLSEFPPNNSVASISQITASSTNKTLHIPILIYHSVRPSRPNETAVQKQYNITPDLFEQQLVYLKDNGFTTISLDQAIKDLDTTTTSTTTKPVLITFDDGWQNQYDYAFPLLEKYGMTATFYIYPNPIGKDERFLTWNEIKEMSNAGMIIGSHSRYHPDFSKMSLWQLKKEIFDSKKILEKKLGQTITHFAPPYGFTNNQIEELIQKAGYKTSRATTKQTNFSKNDLFHLPGYFVPQTIGDFIWIMEKAP